MVAKQVFRFQVSVEIILLVHVGQTLKCLEHYIPDHLLRKQFPPLTHKLVHVQVKVFENEVQHILLQVDLI